MYICSLRHVGNIVTRLSSIYLLFALSSLAKADPKTTLTLGLDHKDTQFSLPANAYDAKSQIGLLSLFRRYDSGWGIGANLSYTVGDSKKADDSTVDTDTLVYGLFVSKYLGLGFSTFAAINKGSNDIDISTQLQSGLTSYNFDSNVKTYTTGGSFALPLSENISASTVISYTHIDSERESYISPVDNSTITALNRKKYQWNISPTVYYRIVNWAYDAGATYTHTSRDDSGANDNNYWRIRVGSRYKITSTSTIRVTISRLLRRTHFEETNIALRLSKVF